MDNNDSLRAARFNALAALADQRTRLTAQELQTCREAYDTIVAERETLQRYRDDYQQSQQHTHGLAPALFCHQRRFVGRLNEQISRLGCRVKAAGSLHEACEARFQAETAQVTALKAIADDRTFRARSQQSRQDQRDQDDVARSRHALNLKQNPSAYQLEVQDA